MSIKQNLETPGLTDKQRGIKTIRSFSYKKGLVGLVDQGVAIRIGSFPVQNPVDGGLGLGTQSCYKALIDL